MSRGFVPAERARLLAMPHIGPGVLERLEAAGFDSVAALRQAGVDRVVDLVCRQVGRSCWANRRKPLARALESLR